MKTWVAILTVIAFLAAIFPASAQEAAPAPSPQPSQAPMFIARGTPLSAQETASLNQRMVFSGRISHDLGGDSDDSNITKADEVFVGVVVIAVVVGVVYLTVVGTQKGSKLF